MEILITYGHREEDLASLPIRDLALFVLEREGKPINTEVSISFVDDTAMAELNERFRGMEGPTDVLSFPMFDLTAGQPPVDERLLDPATHRLPLGDMVISLERATAQAEEYGHSIQRELGYLAVHSVLHLLGYDHMDEGQQKRQMRAREEAIMNEMGVPRG